jgi:hypothetical protein
MQAASTKSPDAKVVICHEASKGKQQTITVSSNAVSSHLAHGDSLGACANGCSSESCDDSNACTVDSCGTDGQCVHQAASCDDGDPCTGDGCDPVAGCISNPATGSVSCDDGNGCTTGDACGGGVCTGQPVPGCCSSDADCEDGNLCTDDHCTNHLCENSPVTCSSADVCVAAFCDPTVGACATAPISCDDGNPCTVDTCAANQGCVHDTGGPDLACEGDGICEAGVCKHPPGDCRVVGCSAGQYCTFCWLGYACIPNGSVC